MKTKIDMAHDYAMALVLSPDFDDDMSLSAFVKHVWKYADKMQAEEDKRKVGGVPDAILNLSNSKPLKSEVIEQILHDIDNYFDSSVSNSLRDANNVIQEVYKSLSGEKNIEDWQPDWSKAPDGVASWHMNENRSSYWVIGSGVHLFEDQGKFLVEAWCVRKPAPSFDYKGDWKDSLRKRP